MFEFAIISNYANGEVSVNYFSGTREDAIAEAQNTQRIGCAESVTIAEVRAFIGENGEMF